MAIFNQTIYQNLTEVTSLLGVANDFSMDALGVGIWLLITFGAMFLTSQYATRESFIASSFISMICSFFLRYLDMLPEFFLWLSGFMFALSIVVAWWITPPNSIGA